MPHSPSMSYINKQTYFDSKFTDQYMPSNFDRPSPPANNNDQTDDTFRNFYNHWEKSLEYDSLRPGDAYMLQWTLIIGSDNVLSPFRRHLNQCWHVVNYSPRTYFIEILFEIQKFSFKKLHWNMWSAKWGPVDSGLKMICIYIYIYIYVFQMIHYMNTSWLGARLQLFHC